MKKIYILILTFTIFLSAIAQQKDLVVATELVTKHSKEIGFTQKSLENYVVSSSYNSDGIQYVYLTQTYKGLSVRNQMKVLSFKNGALSSNAGLFIENIENLVTTQTTIPDVNAKEAVNAAFLEEKLAIPNLTSQPIVSNKFDFGMATNVSEKITGELMWYPVEVKGKISSVNLIWAVVVAPKGTDDMWQIFVDATNGNILGKQNFTVHENLENKSQTKEKKKEERSLINFPKKEEKKINYSNLFASPTAVANASYLVIPYPAESPTHPGGTAAVRSNPWAAATGNASSLGWHSDGTNDYTITRGNNVWATEDRASSDQNSGLPATSSTSPDPLTFNFPPLFTGQPTNFNNFQRFAITNLFYWNNIMHDMSYQYGFTEAAGNFQRNNQGRGGNGNDDVIALAQSGTGTNNANFSTPVDGGRPRMRMYLFDAAGSNINMRVNSPASIVGNYLFTESVFTSSATPAPNGTPLNNKLQDLGPITGQVVYFNDDAAGTTHFACGVPANGGSLVGKIALVDRGNGGVCANANGVPFILKVKNAQDAGAIAVIVVNNVATPLTNGMSGLDPNVTIPAVMISQADGALLAAQLSNNVNVTLSAIRLDGDLDNGVIAHEYGHGISTRLTGGPANSSCLGSNAPANNYCGNTRENGSEGWSDFFGLMLSTNWATAQLTDGVLRRSIGTYANGETPAGAGFRIKPYSTNIAVNNETYANVGDATYCGGIHNIGEVWCTAIWEMTWGIIQQEGVISPNLYEYSPTSNAGNIIAMKLVTEGLKLQPCNPGFVDQRNAILAADRNIYGGRHACAMWTAFAKRGLGYDANQGSSNSVSDQIASSALPPAPTIVTQPIDATAAVGANANFNTSAGSDVNLIYNWQVSTNGGTTWNNVSPITITASLNLNAVTAAMNNNKYRCQVFIGCDITTSAVVTLTVTGGVTPPVISTQPVSTTVCVGANASFTSSATPTGATYSWEVSTNSGTTWAPITPAATTTTLTLNSVSISMNNNRYRLIATNTAGTVTSNQATLTVNAVPAAPTVVPTIAYCQGAATSILTATGTNLLWYTTASGGTGSTTAPTPNTSSAGSTIYYVSQTVGTCESPRAAITVGVTATPPTPFFTNTSINYCQNGVAVPLVLVYPGPDPGPPPFLVTLWFTVPTGGVGSATAPTPSTSLIGTTIYYVAYEEDGCVGPRAPLTVNVTAVPTAPTVTSTINYCQGVTAIALTASGSNLLWYTTPTGGTGSSTAPFPNTSTVGTTSYYVSQTTGCESPRATITVNVVAGTAAPTVTSSFTYCQNATAAILTATGSSLLWYTTSTGGTGSSTAPTPSTAAAGTFTFYVTQTIGICESPRAAIVVTVIATPLAPTVTAIVNYCQNATASVLTAVGTNLKWYNTALGGVGSTTAPLPSTSNLGTTIYYVSQTSTVGSCEGPRASITVNVLSVSPAPTVVSPVVYCQNGNAVPLTATGTNLLWYTTASGGTGSATAPTPITITAGNTTYYVSQNSTCGESARTPLVVTINPTPAAPIVTTIQYCQGATAIALTATGANLLWYTNATGGTGAVTAPIPSTASVGTVNYYVSQSVLTCESARALLAVTTNATPAAPTVTTPVTYCINSVAAPLTASGTNLRWYNSATGGVANTTAPTPSTTAIGSTTYYVSQVSGICEGPRAAIVVNITAVTAAPTVTSPLAYCQGSTAATLTAGGTNLLWYTTATGGTGSATAPTISTTSVGSTTFYVSQTGACESARTPIVVNITSTPTAPTVSTNTISYCQGSTAAALIASGTNLLWYNAATGGTGSATAPIPNTSSVGSTVFYVSQTTGVCEGPRTAITVNVTAAPSITTQPQDITSCSTSATFNVAASGTSLTYQWFESTDNGVSYTAITGATSSTLSLTGLTPAQANNKYRVVVSSGTCTSATSNAVMTKVGTNPVVTLNLTPNGTYNPLTFKGLAASVSPTGTYVYEWKRNTQVVAGNTTATLTKLNGLVDEFGNYQVSATDPATGCLGVSSIVTIADNPTSREKLLVAPNPTRGLLSVTYYSENINNQARTIHVYDEKGSRIFVKTFTIFGRYGIMNIDLTKYTKGTYVLVLADASGKKITSTRIIKN